MDASEYEESGSVSGMVESGFLEEEDNLEALLDPTRFCEVGGDAVWSVSSAKPGSGVFNLRDNNLETYWQSDDMLPHYITIQFQKKYPIKQVLLYADSTKDESYTPQRISILSGTTLDDVAEVVSVEAKDIQGWCSISLSNDEGQPLMTNLLQIAIKDMQQSGRNTHIRQCRVYAPATPITTILGIPSFSSVEARAHSLLR